MGNYPNVAKDLIAACDWYMEKRITLADLQTCVLNAADQIVLVDERDVREFLEDAESDIEGIRFSGEDIEGMRIGTEDRDEILAVVAEIRARMVAYVSS